MRNWKWGKFSFTLLLIFCYFSRLFSQSASIDSIINREELQATIKFLASDALKGRMTGSNEVFSAGNYIGNEFNKAGLKPLDGQADYKWLFRTARPDSIGYNIIGLLPGTERPSEWVIFCAHYDHIGTSSTNPHKLRTRRLADGRDTIYNGANDNASGTAALISLARYFGALKNNKRSLIFIAFSGEELGLVGSRALAASTPNPGAIACVINLEMLGRGSSAFLTGSELGDLRDLLNKELARIDIKRFKKQYFKRDYNPDQNLFKRSDNFPFALLNIPAHTIMAGTDEDQYYHTVDDEPSTLNYGLIERITRAIALAVMPIINGEATPKRIEASSY